MNDAKEMRVQAAVDALRHFMDSELAASKIELEAKLIESHIGRPPFEPAHLHDARVRLQMQGEIFLDRTPTRGGSAPPLFITTDREKRSRKVDDAAARKRLLMSRYYSFVQGEPGVRSSLAGDAGEMAFHDALLRAGVGAPLSTVTRGRPQAGSVHGHAVPGGALDNVFALTRLDSETLAPIGPWGVTVLVEVKNIREWVYPRTQELFQVLVKAAKLTAALPTASFMPMLVTRRVQATTTFMAKNLGFFVIETKRQYLPAEHSRIDPVAFDEVRSELGLLDLTLGWDDTSATQRGLKALQRKYDVQAALDNWNLMCADGDFLPTATQLNRQDLKANERGRLLGRLRGIAARNGLGHGWA